MGLYSRVLMRVSVALLVGVVSPGSGGAQEATFCLPPSEYTDEIVRQHRAIVMATDSLTVARREKRGFPDLSDPTQVFLVNDERVCQRASQAHESRFGPQYTTLPTGDVVQVPWRVWAIRLGPTRYIVFDGQPEGPGRMERWDVYDENFELLSSWVH